MSTAAIRQMSIYDFGPFSVDAHRRLLLREGARVRLPAKAFEILLVLLEENGRLVEKDELLKRVWPDVVVEENNLTVNISALRKSLEESPGEHRYVVTVPGRGYQFVAEVHQHYADELSDEAELPSQITQSVSSDPQLMPRTQEIWTTEVDASHTDTDQASSQNNRYSYSSLLVVAALVGTAIIVAYFAYSGYSHYFAGDDNKRNGSIAVLPFVNMGGDPDAEYLSDGISESLINTLSELRGVKVIASNSSFQYKNKKIDIQKVASELGVEEIVTGRVLRRGESLLISVELVGRDGTHLWGEQYDRKATDLFGLQSQISRTVAEKLRSRLAASQPTQRTKQLSVDPQAYEMLLKGRFYLRKQEVDSQNKALEYYKQAVEIDPNYALANAELATTYIVLYASSFLDPKEFRPKAEAATYKALELDDNLAEAHYALAALKQNNWEWASAEREILRALELNPNLADGYRFYSYYLMVRGRFEESVDAAKRAHELDPLSLAASAHIVNCLNVARHYDEAIELSRKILELDHNFAPAHYSLAGAYEGKGLYLDAIYERQESIKFGGDSPSDQIYLGAVYAKAGDLKTAHQILKRLETSKDYVSPGELAVLYTSLGERDQAFASLEKAYAAHDLQLQFLGADSSFDSLREDPRFKDLMHRIGLT
ncbi:MAG TPA: winged helix-turn-helix domain-containing protein [Pyrinomonadaceae bacterium]